MIHLKAATERGMHLQWRERIQSLVVVLLIMVVSIYGLLAIQTGKTLLDMDYAHSGQSVAAMEKVRAVAEAGGKVESLPQTEVVAPLWIRAMAAVTSDTYSYSAGSVWDTAIVYAQMPDWHRTLLSCHMVLGGLAMLVGVLASVPSTPAAPAPAAGAVLCRHRASLDAVQHGVSRGHTSGSHFQQAGVLCWPVAACHYCDDEPVVVDLSHPAP